MADNNKRSEVGDAEWKTTAWKGTIRDVTRRIGKTESEGSYIAQVGENVAVKHVTKLVYQEDGLRQDAGCDWTIHHGEGFCKFASGGSEAPDANLLVADEMVELCNVMLLSRVRFSSAISVLSSGERGDIRRGEYDSYSGRDKRVDFTIAI